MKYGTANAGKKEPMASLIVLITYLALVSACSPSVFPYKALDGVNHNFDFSSWQMLEDHGPQQKVRIGRTHRSG